MSENKEINVTENGSPAMQRPGSSASSAPEISNSNVTEKKLKTGKKNSLGNLTGEEAEEAVTKLHKRRRKRAVVITAFIALIVIGAILLPNLLKYVTPASDSSAVNVNETVLDHTVAASSIVRVLTSSGTLTAGNTEDINLAGDIEIEEYFVKNGDVISKGDKIATVSKASVMSAVVEIQKKLKTLDTKLNKITTSDDKTVIKADSSARVKAVYVKKGSSAQNVISNKGALMLLSLDGLMACDIDRTEKTTLGNSVTVVLSDKTKVSGSIISVTTDKAVCAISDKKASYQDKVTVLDSSGNNLGSSELYIHSVLPIISYAGTVSSVKVKVNQTVEEGTTLLTLTGTRYSGEFSNLLYKRSLLEDQMKTLFEVYQTGIVYSDHDGEVTGINEDDDDDDDDDDTDKTEKLSSASKKLKNLSVRIDSDSTNWPDENVTSTTGFENYSCVISGFNTSGENTLYSINTIEKSNNSLGDLDYKSLPAEITARNSYIYSNGNLSPDSSTPIYSYDKIHNTWVKNSVSDLAVGDLLIITFSPGSSDAPVWIIRYPDESSSDTSGSGQGTQDGQSGHGGASSSQDWSSLFKGHNGLSGSGYTSSGYNTQSGSTGSSGTTTTEETYEMDETLIASIVNLDTMTVTLSVDELDVININKSQKVTITIDAIKDKTFEGKIESIDTTGTRSSNGNAKYSVKVTLDRTDDMLPNMSASVRADISTTEVLSVPAEALLEKDNKTYCYTSYDSEKDELSGEVEVKTGISDGKNVEIVSGLNEGDKIWYKYADGLVYKFVR